MSARHALAAIALTAAAACGGEDRGKPSSPAGAPGAWQESGEGRTVVARVDGEPVYADCLEGQMTGLGVSRDEALADCVAFELLAQEARRGGYGVHPPAVAALRREMVRAFLDRHFYATYRTPEDIPRADIELLWKRQFKNYFNRPENRSTAFCRAENPDPKTKKTAVGTDADRRAEALARAIYRRIRGRRDLTRKELKAICEEVAAEVGGAKLSYASGTFTRTNAVAEFAEPLFAIPEVGRVSPPVRTAWGWDLILLTHVLPARQASLADAEDELRAMLFNKPEYEVYRRQHFARWLHELMTKHRIERFDDRLAASSAEPE